MNIDFEKLPAVIFDWIETRDFESLDHTQQKEVLLHFSKEEYDELRQSASGLKQQSTEILTVESHKKEALLAHFDRHYGEAAVSPRQIFWQAASVFLFMLCGWLFYQVFDLRAQNVVHEMAATDTVYVDREVKTQPEIIHDTVYRYKESENTSKEELRQGTTHVQAEEQKDMGDLEILEATDLENISNAPRGGSMRDDSLLRRFGFVSM